MAKIPKILPFILCCISLQNVLKFVQKIGFHLHKLILAIIAFLSLSLYADDISKIYKQAQQYEQNGDIKKAMLLYKKAAYLSLKPQKIEVSLKNNKTNLIKSKKDKSILKFGKNSIENYENNTTNNTLKQIIFSKFDVKPYKMNYLLPVTYDNVSHANRRNTETKFQISFKKSLAKNLLGLDDELFLGYTQTSWWQTSEKSSPFRETNYEPELFMLFPYIHANSALKAYKLGILHQSNGQGKELSRSWNRIYLTGIFQAKGVFIIPRVWYRLPEHTKKDINDTSGDDNPDIYDYLGYGDLKISYPYKKNLFSLLLRNNLKFNSRNRGAVEFDWTFPLPWVSDTFGYLQIFSGYGESLIDYNKRNDRIGLGFSITR